MPITMESVSAISMNASTLASTTTAAEIGRGDRTGGGPGGMASKGTAPGGSEPGGMASKGTAPGGGAPGPVESASSGPAGETASGAGLTGDGYDGCISPPG